MQLLRVMLHPNSDLEVDVRHGAGQELSRVAKNWGMVLADVVRHISYAYHQTDGVEVELVRMRVLEAMNKDLEDPDPDHIIGRMRRFDPPGG